MTTKVEIVEQHVPLPPQAQGDPAVADRLGNLGLLGKSRGEAVAGYEVRINGMVLPVTVAHYDVAPTEAGTVVTLLVPADQVTISPAASADDKAPQMWQSGGHDPRADISGWTPEVARG